MKNFTLFNSKSLTDAQLKTYRSKYCTFTYKKGDINWVVVCHGEGVAL